MPSPIRFTVALVRPPTPSVVAGLRAGDGPDPDFGAFVAEHDGYVRALADAGLRVETMAALDDFPDAVFVEDAALCIGSHAIVLRPGAPTRAGEADAIVDDLTDRFATVARVERGYVDGGDILVTGREILVGLSARTDETGTAALADAAAPTGLPVRVVTTPPGVLHFKTDCAIVDDTTIFATGRLAASGCFDGYDVIECPAGEEAAANLIRVNDHVIMRTGFPATETLLRDRGYEVATVQADEAARIDGGLSCMSLRCAP
ncbi:MAG: dimethylarginine dimethylaminohydrolase [Actinomycetota bacterium]